MGSPIALTAYDDHPGFRGWRPLVDAAWRRLGFEPVFIHVTDGEPDTNSIVLRPSAGVSACAYAKYSRLFYAANELFCGRTVLITDMDIIPLDHVHFSMARECAPGYFTAAGGDFFNWQAPPDPLRPGVSTGHVVNYFPTCYCVADQGVWKEILGPVGGIPRWLIASDGRTDEVFMKVALDMWGHTERTFVIPRWYKPEGGRRLCKSNWQWDAEGVRSGKYIDLHMPLYGTVPQDQIDVIEEVVNAR